MTQSFSDFTHAIDALDPNDFERASMCYATKKARTLRQVQRFSIAELHELYRIVSDFDNFMSLSALGMRHAMTLARAVAHKQAPSRSDVYKLLRCCASIAPI